MKINILKASFLPVHIGIYEDGEILNYSGLVSIGFSNNGSGHTNGPPFMASMWENKSDGFCTYPIHTFSSWA